MNPGIRQSAWLPWTIVTLIAVSCCILAVLQYRWITEFSAAERDRMRADLQSRLALLSKNFNDDISNACLALIPDPSQIEANGREKAYAVHYQAWRGSHEQLFRRIALAIPKGSDVALENLELEKNQFAKGEWPADWNILHARLKSRVTGVREPPVQQNEPIGPRAHATMMFPRFGDSPDHPGFVEQEWLIVELNEDYIRDTALPALLKKYLSEPGGINYDTEVTLNLDASKVIFPTADGKSIAATADASVPLFTVSLRMPPPIRGPRPEFEFGRGGRGPGPGQGFGPPPDGGRFGRRGPPPDFRRGPAGRDGDGRGFGPPPGRRGPPPRRDPDAGRPPDFNSPDFNQPREFAQGRWRLYVRHRAGSLEALTARARNRNIFISGGLLFLIVAIVGSLLSVSRQSQRLAESHMNFVAGVSHELRTPLTVIRTAAYNLRGKMANRPEQVEKYGKLIQEESEKLGSLVEQVLQFASGQAGYDIREREPVAVETLIDDSLDGTIESLESRGIQIERRIDAGLPAALADRLAMKHALRNLIDNAVKYGTESNRWIGIFATAITTAKGPGIEIRVADHGPGIPTEEQQHIFDPFFRGKRAIADQIHGTGLGLNLTRRIIEAHGGTIDVESAATGTTFIVNIPAGVAT
jgi:signal transduction histidine kinase